MDLCGPAPVRSASPGTVCELCVPMCAWCMCMCPGFHRRLGCLQCHPLRWRPGFSQLLLGLKPHTTPGTRGQTAIAVGMQEQVGRARQEGRKAGGKVGRREGGRKEGRVGGRSLWAPPQEGLLLKDTLAVADASPVRMESQRLFSREAGGLGDSGLCGPAALRPPSLGRREHSEAGLGAQDSQLLFQVCISDTFLIPQELTTPELCARAHAWSPCPEPHPEPRPEPTSGATPRAMPRATPRFHTKSSRPEPMPETHTQSHARSHAQSPRLDRMPGVHARSSEWR